ncbi:MAG: hypothetical protein H6807_12330 [Planctomycetes bacterium]|nr:hypothetical protein [Planctomycetota bacterium]
MITINLLPKEYRKKEKTPIALLLPILGGLICVLSAASVAAYTHFVWLGEVQNRRQGLDQELAQKQPRLRYEESLLSEEKEYKKRADTIKDIAAGRIVMTEKLDQLADITVAGDETADQGYLVWIKELKYSPPSANAGKTKVKGAPAVGGEMSLKGLALADSDPLVRLNYYHAALKNSDWFRFGFTEISDPVGNIEEFPELEPKKGWTMDLDLQMTDPVESRKLRAAAMKMVAEKDAKPQGGATRKK